MNFQKYLARSLAESAGLPVAAYALAAWTYGRDGGLVAAAAAIWLTAVIRKVATGSVPSLLTISAVVLTLQTAVVLASGELWLFLVQFPLANPGMCVQRGPAGCWLYASGMPLGRSIGCLLANHPWRP